MLRIGLCDDNQDARLNLYGALERSLEKQNMQARFLEFSSGEGLLHWMAKHTGELDLVFLDMEMGELDGIETARKLRALDNGIQLVFVTAYTDRVFDGYSVGALGYLMKPPKAEQLNDILTRANAALCVDTGKTFICRSGDVIYRILIKDILYFFSSRRQITCVARQRNYTFYGKLDQVERELGPGFVRIHQRYLVHASAVERIAGSEIFIGESVLPVSRSCQQTAMLALTRTSLEE